MSENQGSCIFTKLLQHLNIEGSVSSLFILSNFPPGSGKSIFGMAFIAEGCRNNEKCIYITVEQPPEQIIEQACQFGWDYRGWMSQGLLNVYHIDFKKPFEMGMFDEVLKNMENTGYSRMVIDSINPLSFKPLPIFYRDTRPVMPERVVTSEITRANIITLFDTTRSKGITTVCITQRDSNDVSNMIVEYIGDGLIYLDISAIGEEANRTLQIKKLRKTRINPIQHTFKFAEEGIMITS
ncbi:MAG: ATPase domain-containing protein [Candidatus Thermoplasmatota archaeon]